MNNSQPRLLQTFLPSGTLEGIRIIELSESSVKAFVIPRLQLKNAKQREELLRPSLYFLISSGDSQAYIGESENFFHRLKNHDQNKQFWDMAIAIVSTTNNLEKSDVKYLESLAVERAQQGSMTIENRTIPARNTIHEFKLHTLQKILDDTQLMLTSLGYDILSPPVEKEETWYCSSKKTDAKAQFRGDQFVLLKGSIIDKTYTHSWVKDWPQALLEREDIFSKSGRDLGDVVEIIESVAFRSPNHAGGFATGRSVNAWTTWKNELGQTMDEVMRKL